MNSEEKIRRVLETIRKKAELLPEGISFKYRAGQEGSGLSSGEEIKILNKLADEKIIDIINNAGSEFI